MENDYKEEIFTGKSPDPITIEGTETILNQMKQSICKICKEDGSKGTGFFCNIPLPNKKLLPVLITNEHVISKNEINNKKLIKITLDNDKKYLNIPITESRKVYTSKKYDITMIEIKPEKDKINNFLSVDPDIYKDQNILETTYKNKSIYILNYLKGENIHVSYGLISEVSKIQIYHLCNTDTGSSGSPILSLNTFKVIGVHKGSPRNSSQKNNVGTFIKYAIEEFIGNKSNEEKEINKSSVNSNVNNKYNELNIIYILGDFDSEVKLFGENFVKNNNDKCILIIDGKERKLMETIEKSEIKNIKKNILKIKLRETKTITDMSYMFQKCSNLIDLPDISNWDTSSVTNMKSMFEYCEALSKLSDISKWDTSNVTDMSNMFNYCISLSEIPDISNWNIKNLRNKNDMFLDCKKQLNIPNKFK